MIAMFTPMETKVYNLMIEGKTNKEIGQELNVSERTIETHMRSILIKTKCKNRIELLANQISEFHRKLGGYGK